MLPAFAMQTVTRLRGVETTDDYGNTVIDWSAPDSAEITGCSVQPQPAAEFTDTREEVLSRWQLWAPIDADIKHTDRISYAGDVFLVEGSVQRWPQLELDHTTCLLRLLNEE